MKFIVRNRLVFFNIGLVFLSPIIIFVTILLKKRRNTIIWGPAPLINYKYWSSALSDKYKSISLVKNFFHINNRIDFDLIYEDLLPFWLKSNENIISFFGPIFAYFYTISHAYSVNTSFHGGHFSDSVFWKWEMKAYKYFKIHIIIQPYGSDVWMYSKIWDNTLKHALLLSYPNAAFKEKTITKKISFLSEISDIIMPCLITYGLPYWSCLPVNMLSINNDAITKKTPLTIGRKLRIIHAPNHKGFKGTTHIIQIINDLISEGYNIEFKLLEKIKNDEVLQELENSDILVEQLLFNGYALNAVEAMAKGLVVLSNLNDDKHNELFRRFSFLNECPILSSTPESLKDNLILIIENENLRNQLSDLGVKYVQKYHSEKSTQFLFTNIFKKLDGEDIDLMNLYHPLKSEYVKTNYIETPLVNNRYVE